MITAPETIVEPRTSICSMMDTDYTRLIEDLHISPDDEVKEIKYKLQNYLTKNSPPYKPCDQGILVFYYIIKYWYSIPT